VAPTRPTYTRVKGIILLGIERYVATRHGEAALDAILLAAQPRLSTSEPVLGVATYPDADAVVIVETACAHFGITAEAFLRDVGRFCFPVLSARYAWAVAGHRNYRSFLVQLERAIHVEVDKVVEGARTPRFRFHWRDERHVRIEYRSERAMCALAAGLLEGGAQHFEAPILLEEVACTARGDDCCAWEGVLS
jgi:hypothetical protein